MGKSAFGQVAATLMVVTLVASALAPGAGAATTVPPQWAIDPAEPGPDLPPSGRSLFDFMVSTGNAEKPRIDLPFPFESLVRQVETSAGCNKPCAKQVLIPLGRSLQRTAAAPDFFRHPRAVVAIDTEPAGGGAFLKDRVYLAYQEKADLIEVISYNETAARFEFQLVRDYRRGVAPEVVYARRALCVACHQNQAPIFARQLWGETNANPRVAALLARERDVWYGIPAQRGVDEPNAIDDATDRANSFAVWQRLWLEGCGSGEIAARCRAALLLAVLQHGLTDGRGFERGVEWREAFVPVYTKVVRTRWPGGLAIANPDLPNRDPLAHAHGAAMATGVALSHVEARFEPLAPRQPLEVLVPDSPAVQARLVDGLAQFLAAADLQALDRQLATRAVEAVQPSVSAPCTVIGTSQWLRFDCSSTDEDALRLNGRIELDGAEEVRHGQLRMLALQGAQPLMHLGLTPVAFDAIGARLQLTPTSGPLSARLTDGRRLVAIELTWPPQPTDSSERYGVTGQARMTLVDDFAPLRRALHDLAADRSDGNVLGDGPFIRARLMPALLEQLGANYRIECCLDDRALPPPQVEPPPPTASTADMAAPYAPFFPLCADCHATQETAPPNFLFGSGERITENLRQCAPRIYVRLALWQVEPRLRAKTPMPPAPLAAGSAPLRPPLEVGGLLRQVAKLLQHESGTQPQLDRLLAAGYEHLPPCLAAN